LLKMVGTFNTEVEAKVWAEDHPHQIFCLEKPIHKPSTTFGSQDTDVAKAARRGFDS